MIEKDGCGVSDNQNRRGDDKMKEGGEKSSKGWMGRVRKNALRTEGKRS